MFDARCGPVDLAGSEPSPVPPLVHGRLGDELLLTVYDFPRGGHLLESGRELELLMAAGLLGELLLGGRAILATGRIIVTDEALSSDPSVPRLVAATVTGRGTPPDVGPGWSTLLGASSHPRSM